jgi:small subunit ribosomal protein S18
MSDNERREGGFGSGQRPYRSGGGRRPENGRGGYSGPRGRRPFGPTRKVCAFCVEKGKQIDYKNADMLRRYVTERGKIRSGRKSGTCARHQRRLAVALKRARYLALLPFTSEHIRLY